MICCPVASGQNFCVDVSADGTIIFFGELDRLVGIDATSAGGHLAFNQVENGPIESVPDVAPFPNSSVSDFFLETPNRLSYAVSDVSLQVDLSGRTPTGMRYDGNLGEFRTDLALQFAIGDYIPVALPTGLGIHCPVYADCNGDGVYTAADLECVEWGPVIRDVILYELQTLPGDLDGNGDVSFSDFLVLSANFGTRSFRYTDGNVDMFGEVIDFADFLILSGNFGKTPVAAAVPEPSVGVMGVLGFAGFLGLRRR